MKTWSGTGYTGKLIRDNKLYKYKFGIWVVHRNHFSEQHRAPVPIIDLNCHSIGIKSFAKQHYVNTSNLILAHLSHSRFFLTRFQRKNQIERIHQFLFILPIHRFIHSMWHFIWIEWIDDVVMLCCSTHRLCMKRLHTAKLLHIKPKTSTVFENNWHLIANNTKEIWTPSCI